MSTFIANLPWFQRLPSPSRLLRLAPRRRTYRCLLVDGPRRDPVACSSFSAEEAAKTVAWEALTEERFNHGDEAVVRVHVLGEADERSFRFARSWHLASETTSEAHQMSQMSLAG